MTCPIGTDVSRAARILREGGLVAFATETVYGLGADVFSAQAVARVFEVKDRPQFDPLIVHVPDVRLLDRLAANVPAVARTLIDRFWPGPLSLVLPKTDAVPDLATAGLTTVAMRCPDHPQALRLLTEAAVPVAAPSANPFGRLSPTRAEHVAEQLGDRIDYILDGGPCRVGIESTVLDVTTGPPRLLRPGGVPLEALEAVIGRIAVEEEAVRPDASQHTAQSSPGRLPSHYAPTTPLVLLETPNGVAGRVGLISFTPPVDGSDYAAIEVLSPSGDLIEAASAFFAALRRLDASGLELIVARPFPETGLGRAMNDRLRRAARRT